MKTRWIDEDRLQIVGDTATVRREGSATPDRQVHGSQQVRDASSPVFDSKLEAAYDQYLAALKHAGVILEFWYHPLTLKLPGGPRYTPDFMVWPAEPGARVQIHECKGFSKNMRDGMTRLKVASGLYRCFDWRLVRRIKSQWDVTTL